MSSYRKRFYYGFEREVNIVRKRVDKVGRFVEEMLVLVWYYFERLMNKV